VLADNEQKLIYPFPIGNWKRLGKRWKTWRTILHTVQNAKKPHPAGWENTK